MTAYEMKQNKRERYIIKKLRSQDEDLDLKIKRILEARRYNKNKILEDRGKGKITEKVKVELLKDNVFNYRKNLDKLTSYRIEEYIEESRFMEEYIKEYNIESQKLPTLQTFIDIGWFTVPIGSIHRDEEGKKHIEGLSDWKSLINIKNTKDSKTGAVITGQASNILVIDDDTGDIYDRFGQSCNYVVKTHQGYHLYYRYDRSIELYPNLKNSSIKNEDWKIDILVSNRLVFLPTEGTAGIGYEALNRTPRCSEDLNIIPKSLTSFLKLVIVDDRDKLKTRYKNKKHISSDLVELNLDSILRLILDNTREEENRHLWGRITPIKYRDLTSDGVLLPEEVQDGEGSNYMSRLASILASDDTVDEELFIDFMTHCNERWSDPIEDALFTKVYINRYILGEAVSDEGIPFWKYDPDHNKEVDNVIPTLKGSLLALVKEARSGNIMFTVKGKSAIIGPLPYTKLSAEILHITGKLLSKQDVISIPSGKFINDISLDWGEKDKDDNINIALRSPYTRIVQDGSLKSIPYEYSSWSNIFKLTANLVGISPHIYNKYKDGQELPEEMMYILKFISYKIKYNTYSPVYFIIYGDQGSGKSFYFNELIDKILTPPNSHSKQVYPLRAMDLSDKYNGYLAKVTWVSMSDIAKGSSKSAFTEKMKALTGDSHIAIREMNINPYTVPNKITYVISANDLPLKVSDSERRQWVVKTGPKLGENRLGTDWFSTETIMKDIDEEINSFCMYLHTLNKDHSFNKYYMNPKRTKAKEVLSDQDDYIDESMAMIAHSIRLGDYSKLAEKYDLDLRDEMGIFRHTPLNKKMEEEMSREDRVNLNSSKVDISFLVEQELVNHRDYEPNNPHKALILYKTIRREIYRGLGIKLSLRGSKFNGTFTDTKLRGWPRFRHSLDIKVLAKLRGEHQELLFPDILTNHTIYYKKLLELIEINKPDMISKQQI